MLNRYVNAIRESHLNDLALGVQHGLPLRCPKSLTHRKVNGRVRTGSQNLDLDYVVYPCVGCESNLVIAHGGLPRKRSARRQRIRLTVFLGLEERGTARVTRRASKVRHLILSDVVISTLVAEIIDYAE